MWESFNGFIDINSTQEFPTGSGGSSNQVYNYLSILLANLIECKMGLFQLPSPRFKSHSLWGGL